MFPWLSFWVAPPEESVAAPNLGEGALTGQPSLGECSDVHIETVKLKGNKGGSSVGTSVFTVGVIDV